MGSEKEGMEPMSQSNKSRSPPRMSPIWRESPKQRYRVFSRRDYVRDDTVEKVMAAAKELGYKPVTASKGLGGRETNLIAVVSLNFVNPFYQTLLIRLSEMVSAMGKQLLFVESPYEQDLDDILYRVLQYNVDAVIVLSAALSVRMSDKFSRVKVPLVLFNCQYDSRYFFSVCSDNVDAGSMVADYLVAKGYDSFGFISGKPSARPVSSATRVLRTPWPAMDFIKLRWPAAITATVPAPRL